MTRFRDQAHREPVTLGDWLDYIAANRWAIARDFAALVFIVAVGIAAYILLWGASK
jgi:hypothetical protein